MPPPRCFVCLAAFTEPPPPETVPVCATCWAKLSPDSRATVASNYDLRTVIEAQGVSEDGSTQIARAAKAIERLLTEFKSLREDVGATTDKLHQVAAVVLQKIKESGEDDGEAWRG